MPRMFSAEKSWAIRIRPIVVLVFLKIDTIPSAATDAPMRWSSFSTDASAAYIDQYAMPSLQLTST